MSSATIEPGQDVSVVLPLAMGMHAGMAGPHLFRINVPVRNANGESGTVLLYFEALFK